VRKKRNKFEVARRIGGHVGVAAVSQNLNFDASTWRCYMPTQYTVHGHVAIPSDAKILLWQPTVVGKLFDGTRTVVVLTGSPGDSLLPARFCCRRGSRPRDTFRRAETSEPAPCGVSHGTRFAGQCSGLHGSTSSAAAYTSSQPGRKRQIT
jgi:hypothetical protein